MALKEFTTSCQAQIGTSGVNFSAGISGTWVADKAQQEAAWEMYVELITRITTVELAPDGGLLSEALNSLHSLFPTTRCILRNYGPAVAKRKRRSDYSFGGIAVAVLNRLLRPFLAKWHPELDAYQACRGEGVSPVDHERCWEKNQELRQDLGRVRQELCQYADCLAKIARVDPLHSDEMGR